MDTKPRWRVTLDFGLQYATVYVRADNSIGAENAAEKIPQGRQCVAVKAEIAEDQAGPVDVMAADFDPNSAESEAIANADAHLNNVGLPNTYELARHLKELMFYSDALRGSAVHDRCRRVIAAIEPHLAASI